MKQAYKKHLRVTYSASGDEYLEDDKVEVGFVLVVRNLAATFDNMAATEEAQFYVKHGSDRFFLGEDLAAVTDGYPQWSGPVTIGEGDQIGVYLADMAGTEVGHLFVFGELWDIESWRAAS